LFSKSAFGLAATKLANAEDHEGGYGKDKKIDSSKIRDLKRKLKIDALNLKAIDHHPENQNEIQSGLSLTNKNCASSTMLMSTDHPMIAAYGGM
jgi:hypothetical protein